MRDCRVVLFWSNLGGSNVRKGTLEQPLPVQLIQQPSRYLAGEVTSLLSICQKKSPCRGIVLGPGIHLPAEDCSPAGCRGFGEPWAGRLPL